MRKKINRLWAEKYRPQTVDSVIFQNPQQKAKFKEYVANGEIPHLLFQGVQGSGKTSLAGALINDLNVDPMDVLKINASKENNVDTMRNKISSFVETYAIGKFKIVRLEEMDFLSLSAQAALRDLMEDYSDHVRFIGTCNYINKIIPALRSRFGQEYFFKAPSFEDVIGLAATVLISENVEFENEVLEKYITVCYPDIRKLIGSLEHNSVGGKLVLTDSSESSDYKFKLLDLLSQGNIRELRKVVCAEVSREEYEDVYRFMYENIGKSPKFQGDNEEAAVVLIADYLYKHALVADPEINFHALCIKLAKL